MPNTKRKKIEDERVFPHQFLRLHRLCPCANVRPERQNVSAEKVEDWKGDEEDKVNEYKRRDSSTPVPETSVVEPVC